MINYQKIRIDQEMKLQKAIDHLSYTYKKIQALTDDCSIMNEEELETWESFASRFARVSDIFLTRYLRTRVLESVFTK